jgi:anti-sigma regulatory factor (Ser/Thr protein kinase)
VRWTVRRSLIFAPIETRTSLPPDVTSAAAARRFVRDALSNWDLLDCEEVTTLAVSELVTNAVLHARCGPDLILQFAGRRLRVEVHDTSHVLPARKRYAIDAGTGRGMLLVEALVGGWGVEPTASGKVVWFEVRPGQGGGRRPMAMELDPETLADLEELSAGLESPSGRSEVAGVERGGGGGPEARRRVLVST